jgi:jumonji domain-containing protein 7
MGENDAASVAAAGGDPISELITTHNELNSSVVDKLREEPSPLEFMRYVSRNTPFVVKRGAAAWPAVKRWSVPYLKETLAGQTVNVAVTPKGLVGFFPLCFV